MEQQQSTREQTLGEARVRVDFNPSANSIVDTIKQKTAELIDLCEEMRGKGGQASDRLISLAETAYEEAAMWAVKAYTW